jgi:pyrroloquinoline-quinone synthase
MDLLSRLDAARDRWNVLEHPFYVRWSEGALTPEELAWYAGEYRHAVVALADGLGRASAMSPEPEVRRALAGHAAEERSHVALWDDFAGAVGGATDRPAAEETERCVEAWSGGRDTLEALAAAYAIESAQPAIAQTKLDGLRAHYGVEDGAATEYFVLHAERDHDHATHSAALIAARATELDGDRLVAAAEGAVRGNWELLDGVSRRFADG